MGTSAKRVKHAHPDSTFLGAFVLEYDFEIKENDDSTYTVIGNGKEVLFNLKQKTYKEKEGIMGHYCNVTARAMIVFECLKQHF